MISRFAQFVLVPLLLSQFYLPVLADGSLTRVWKDKTGKFSVQAKLIDVAGETIVLKRPDDKRIPVRLDLLCEEDVKFIGAVASAESSSRQFALLMPHLERLAGSPKAVYEVVQILHKEQETAVPAGLYSSALAASMMGPKALTRAQRTVGEVISRLKSIRAEFPNYHDQTLISALNNRALMQLRSGKSDAAANYLVEAADVCEQTPFVVYHNAMLLLEVSALPNSRLALGPKTYRKLTQLLANSQPEAPGANIPARFMYTYNHDHFGSVLKPEDIQPKLKNLATPIAPPEPGYELLGSGSGALVGDDLVITNRHVVEGHEVGFRFTIKNESSAKNAIPANVIEVSDVPEIDLAVLKLSRKPNARALPIVAREAAIGQDLAVLGYPRPDTFEASLTVSRGVVNKFIKEGKNLLHDAATNGGNSGGPCIDNFGNVIGVHYAVTLFDGADRRFAVSASATREFLSSIAGFKELPPNTDEQTLAKNVSDCRDSVFMIEVWGTSSQKRQEASSDSKSEFNSLSKFRLIAELTCLDCSGTGWYRCPNCANGVVSVKKREQVSVNRINGSPIYGNKVYREKCGVCSGKGGFDCRSCTNGVLGGR